MLQDVIAEYKLHLAGINCTTKKLRQFALILSMVWVAVWWWQTTGRGEIDWWRWLLLPPTILLLLVFFRPFWLIGFYRLWLSLAFILGAIVSRVLLGGLFFLALTPLRWLARLFGRHFLIRRPDRKAVSYWQDRKVSKSLEQPF
jgi:hypothetical protein